MTKFRVISRGENDTQVELIPLTGRTHQLRVHAADSQGLGMPIVGDRLYGVAHEGDHSCLHARELHFFHPRSGERIILRA